MYSGDPMEKTKDSYVKDGDEAFVSLASQIQELLGLIDFYLTRYPPDTLSLIAKHEQLQQAIKSLGTLPYQLAEVIRRWKHDEPRVLSSFGVEIEILNEIIVTIFALTEFFIREGISLDPFNNEKMLKAWRMLLVVNRELV
jgi:hypothetical protein